MADPYERRVVIVEQDPNRHGGWLVSLGNCGHCYPMDHRTRKKKMHCTMCENPPKKTDIEVFAIKFNNDKRFEQVEIPVDHEAGVIVRIGDIELHITKGDVGESVNIRGMRSLVVRPRAANSIDIEEHKR